MWKSSWGIGRHYFWVVCWRWWKPWHRVMFQQVIIILSLSNIFDYLLLNYFRSKYCDPVALPQEEYEFEREELWLKSNFWSVYVSVLSELSQCELFTSGVVISSVHCTFYIVHYMLYKQTHNIHTAVHTCVWPIFHVNADVIVIMVFMSSLLYITFHSKRNYILSHQKIF